MAAAIRELRDPLAWALAALALLANVVLRVGWLKAVLVALVVLAVRAGAGMLWPRPKQAPARGQLKPGTKLTPREVEVAALIAGHTNKEIGRLLVPKVQETGVDKHVANIMDKLNVNTRAEIAVWYERYAVSSEPK
jgi:DNA-binding NarL/FixJ family response regulator